VAYNNRGHVHHLAAIIQTLRGTMTFAQACEALGVGRFARQILKLHEFGYHRAIRGQRLTASQPIMAMSLASRSRSKTDLKPGVDESTPVVGMLEWVFW
jgi:hypothetical protein